MPENVKWYGKCYGDKFEAELDRNIRAACLGLERYIKKSFGSAPGVPGVVTGRMKGSIKVERSGKLSYKVGSTLQPQEGQPHSYPYYLEYGFRRGGKKFQYPWLRPALDANKRELRRRIGKKIKIRMAG